MTFEKTDMLLLGRQQADMFMANNSAYCEVLVTSYCPRAILLMGYNRLVRQRRLTPIEDLRQDQKESAWEMAKDIAKGRLGKNALVELVKALLTIEYFLNL